MTKDKMKHLLLVILIAGLPFSALAQNKVGTTAAPFLGIAVGPKAQAMGGAFVAMANDVSAAYWNPGALARLGSSQFMVSHTEWFLETSFNWVGLSLNLGSGNYLGLSFTQLDYGREEITTLREQEGTGRFWNASDIAASLTFARALTNRFSLGGSAKIINSKIWNESASALAIDLGVLFITNFNNMQLGMSISNYGTKMRMDGKDLLQQIDVNPDATGHNETLVARLKTEDYELPIFFRLGLAYDLLNVESNRLTLAVDALHPTDNVESMNIGAEYGFMEMVFLRAGYKSLFQEDSEEGLTLGAGVEYRLSGVGAFLLNYSWAEFGVLGDIQTFGFTFSF